MPSRERERRGALLVEALPSSPASGRPPSGDLGPFTHLVLVDVAVQPVAVDVKAIRVDRRLPTLVSNLDDPLLILQVPGPYWRDQTWVPVAAS